MVKYSQIHFFFLSLFLLCIFSFAVTANAQTSQDIQAIVSPQYPKAGQNVSIHLQSTIVPLDQANISWLAAGTLQTKGFGLTDFSTVAGKIGSITRITARIVTSNGITIDKTITIQPADIDILWQATSYVPPFYAGKALYPHQGLITFTAIPNVTAGQSLTKTAGSYIYTWKKDGDVLGNFSGYGKNTFVLRGAIISRPFSVEVDVSSAAGVQIGTASVIVEPRAPEVALYEKSPLLGVLYNNKLENHSMQGKELSIAAVPFYFNTGNEPAELEYSWTMNGNPIASQSDPSVLTVRKTENVSGNATVGLKINNLLKTLQFASDSLNITFEKDNETGL